MRVCEHWYIQLYQVNWCYIFHFSCPLTPLDIIHQLILLATCIINLIKWCKSLFSLSLYPDVSQFLKRVPCVQVLYFYNDLSSASIYFYAQMRRCTPREFSRRFPHSPVNIYEEPASGDNRARSFSLMEYSRDFFSFCFAAGEVRNIRKRVLWNPCAPGEELAHRTLNN